MRPLRLQLSTFLLPTYLYLRYVGRRFGINRFNRRRGLILLLCTITFVFLLRSSTFFSASQCGTHVRLAMSIQASPDTAKQVGRLLDSIWESCNLYAIHIDAKLATHERHRIISSLRNKYPRNVLIIPSRHVAYAGVSMLLATLDCLSALLDHRVHVPWSFFINLSAADYPLVTPATMRRVLSSQSISGINFFQPQVATKSTDWFFARRFSSVHLDPALWNTQGEVTHSGATHSFADPLKIPLRKAEGWVILWHEFAHHVLHSPDSRTLLALFANARASDEHFFPTLQAMSGGTFPAVMDAMRHIAWSNGTHMLGRPAFLDGTLQGVLRDELFSSGALIARKFGSGGALQDQIDCGLSGLWGTAGCSEEEISGVISHTARVQRRLQCSVHYRKVGHEDPSAYETCVRYEQL